MLGVRRRGGEGAHDGGIERPARGRDQRDERDATSDLEAARPDVLVGHPVAEHMENRPEQRGREP